MLRTYLFGLLVLTLFFVQAFTSNHDCSPETIDNFNARLLNTPDSQLGNVCCFFIRQCPDAFEAFEKCTEADLSSCFQSAGGGMSL